MTQELEKRIESLESQVEDLNYLMGLAAQNASKTAEVIVNLLELITTNNESRKLDNLLREVEIENLRLEIMGLLD